MARGETALFVLTLAVALGCQPDEAPRQGRAPRSAPKAPEAPAVEPDRALPAVADAQAPRKHSGSASEMPLEFPVVKTSAAKGDVVLAPARAWIDNAAERGVENQAFIFDPARMMEPGANASVVETRHRQKSLVPNGLIVAIRPAQSADPGDVVLTHWHSRSGLQRAIIVEGGEPAEPLALYLDVAYENPPGWGQKKEKLAPGSFHVLKKVGEVGTTVACTDGQKKRRGVVISRAPERLLVVGYAGLLTSRDPAECQPIPISPKVAEGDQVWVPRLGTFVRAAVTKVDAGSGRVFATAPGEKTPTATGYSNVASKLE